VSLYHDKQFAATCRARMNDGCLYSRMLVVIYVLHTMHVTNLVTPDYDITMYDLQENNSHNKSFLLSSILVPTTSGTTANLLIY
jgi:hypothetical protein